MSQSRKGDEKGKKMERGTDQGKEPTKFAAAVAQAPDQRVPGP